MPSHGCFLLENLSIGNIIDQFSVSGFVEFLHFGNLLERLPHRGVTFVAGDFGKVGIERGPLQVLSGSGRLQIRLSIFYGSGRIRGRYLGIPAFKMLKEYLGVFLFIFRSFSENVSNLFKARFFAAEAK